MKERKVTLTIQLEEGAIKELEKRAKKKYLTVRELATDIIRRSILSYKYRNSRGKKDNVNDKFLAYFSRRNVGRKPSKRKNKKSSK